jgi:hypothetical protein
LIVCIGTSRRSVCSALAPLGRGRVRKPSALTMPGAIAAGHSGLRADLTTIPLDGVEPGHVVLATRAGDRSRLVATFGKSARECITSPAAATISPR